MISLDIPVHFKLIANGERIIEQMGSDELDVDVRDGEVKGSSWIPELIRLFDEVEREGKFKSRRRQTTKRKNHREANKPGDAAVV